jgi:hypothetical protein
MLITKFNFRNEDTPKESRVPFYLYVDEFQTSQPTRLLKFSRKQESSGLPDLANQLLIRPFKRLTQVLIPFQ